MHWKSTVHLGHCAGVTSQRRQAISRNDWLTYWLTHSHVMWDVAMSINPWSWNLSIDNWMEMCFTDFCPCIASWKCWSRAAPRWGCSSGRCSCPRRRRLRHTRPQEYRQPCRRQTLTQNCRGPMRDSIDVENMLAELRAWASVVVAVHRTCNAGQKRSKVVWITRVRAPSQTTETSLIQSFHQKFTNEICQLQIEPNSST